MQKAKKYDWQDSNLALFGSDVEKKVKKESAQSEPAWAKAGEEVGVKVWRINKFQVEHWPSEDNGNFYSGDSYIVLHTYKEPDTDELNYNLHFWIGKYSTQDEYGTAAYKTVELDTFLDDKPIQHRQVQGHETLLFKDLFGTFVIMKGGVDTGFKRVLPKVYKPRFFKVKKQANRKITMTEIGLKKCNYVEDDVFILDIGSDVYQINGDKCTADEKFAAAQQLQSITGSRSRYTKKHQLEGCPFDDADIGHYFVDKAKKEKTVVEFTGVKLLKVIPGKAPALIAEGTAVGKTLLDPDDAFIIDTKDVVYVWIGKGASVDERRNALPNACNYLATTSNPCKAVTVVAGGKEPAEFNSSF